ncbi:MAG: general secretion pathway protein D, partial [Psychromonas sp.]
DAGVNLMPNAIPPVLPEWGQSYEINPDNFTGLESKSQQPTTEGLN